MLIVYYFGLTRWKISIESLSSRWLDAYYPPNACEWIVPGTAESE